MSEERKPHRAITVVLPLVMPLFLFRIASFRDRASYTCLSTYHKGLQKTRDAIACIAGK